MTEYKLCLDLKNVILIHLLNDAADLWRFHKVLMMTPNYVLLNIIYLYTQLQKLNQRIMPVWPANLLQINLHCCWFVYCQVSMSINVLSQLRHYVTALMNWNKKCSYKSV